MKFIIKPHAKDPSFNLLLETAQYQREWKANSRKILRAFREVTDLDFQQRVITAYVYEDNKGDAGKPYYPMHLPSDYSSQQTKSITIIHELAHRLLGGNALEPVALGLIPNQAEPHPDYQEYEHRHTYLFEYDVVEKALGSEYASLCNEEEERYNIDGPHDRAWEWAMSFTYEERQRILKVLTSYKTERDQWEEFFDKKVERIDPKEWEAKLVAAAKQAKHQ
jgi:hypothetical protein